MQLKIYNNITECGRIWNQFSPNRNLFDIWEFRQCFYNREDHKPHFIVGKQNSEITGFIPLYYIKSLGKYTYFGGWFPERNSFFMKNKKMLSMMLEHCPSNTSVEGISPEERAYYDFSEDEYTYFIDLKKYDYSFEKYFGSFDKKKQKNFKRDLNSIPKHNVHLNRLKDFKRLMELNLRQFEDDSIYADKNIKNSLQKMVRLAHRKGLLQMLSIEINKKIEAVDVGISLGERYYVVTGSSNNHKIPNIGKLLTTLDIKNAISRGARYVDFLASSDYWKMQWSFDKAMMFKFDK